MAGAYPRAHSPVTGATHSKTPAPIATGTGVLLSALRRERGGYVIQCTSGKVVPREEVEKHIATAIHSAHVGAPSKPCFMCRTDAKAVTVKLAAIGIVALVVDAASAVPGA